MSRKRPENSESNGLPPDLDDGSHVSDANSAGVDDAEMDPTIADAQAGGDFIVEGDEKIREEDDEEFSLDQLREAYARVLHKDLEGSEGDGPSGAGPNLLLGRDSTKFNFE